MDNSKILHLNSSETMIDETASIYLSCDSSTVEDEENIFEREEDRENQDTVIKRCIQMTPMRKTAKSILQEINVFSSTPTQKEDIDQIQLEMAALGLAPLAEIPGEEKLKKGPNLSTISENTLEITTSSKQKGGDENCDGDKTIENKSENVIIVSSSGSENGSSSDLSIIVVKSDSENPLSKCMYDDENKENICEKKPPVRGLLQICEIEQSLEDKENTSGKIENFVPPVISTLNQGNTAKVPKIGAGNKPNSGAIPKLKMGSPYDTKVEAPPSKRTSTIRIRKSLMPCEPDLNLNRPSRIEKGIKSLSTNTSQPSSTVSTNTSIPRLLLKTVVGMSPTKPSSSREKEDGSKKANLKRNSMIPPPPKSKSTDLRKRQSRFVSPSNKRQTAFKVPSSNTGFAAIKQKISSVAELSPRGLPKKSGILKTTLNSSAASRRSFRKSISTTGGPIPKLPRNSLIPLQLNSVKARPKSPKEANKKPANDPKKPKQIMSMAPCSNDIFSCDKCPRTFRLASSLEAHKVLHNVKIVAPICKFCDKKFVIKKALTNHLLENCTKIPTSERKKLLFPPTASQNNDRAKGDNTSISKPGLPQHSPQSAKQNDLEKSSLGSKKLEPPTTSARKNKGKVPAAHSGVYRTPNKPITCYPCKKTFEGGLGFTDHLVFCHSSSDPDS